MDPLDQNGTEDAFLKQSLAEQAERLGMGEDDEQVELFPDGFMEGDDLKASKMIKPGQGVQVTASIGKAEVPTEGGLIDPERQNGRVLVSYKFVKNEDVPTWSDDGEKVTDWKIRQHFRAIMVISANDPVKLISAEFERMLYADEAGAGKLLDELREMFSQNATAQTG